MNNKSLIWTKIEIIKEFFNKIVLPSNFQRDFIANKENIINNIITNTYEKPQNIIHELMNILEYNINEKKYYIIADGQQRLSIILIEYYFLLKEGLKYFNEIEKNKIIKLLPNKFEYSIEFLTFKKYEDFVNNIKLTILKSSNFIDIETYEDNFYERETIIYIFNKLENIINNKNNYCKFLNHFLEQRIALHIISLNNSQEIKNTLVNINKQKNLDKNIFSEEGYFKNIIQEYEVMLGDNKELKNKINTLMKFMSVEMEKRGKYKVENFYLLLNIYSKKYSLKKEITHINNKLNKDIFTIIIKEIFKNNEFEKFIEQLLEYFKLKENIIYKNPLKNENKAITNLLIYLKILTNNKNYNIAKSYFDGLFIISVLYKEIYSYTKDAGIQKFTKILWAAYNENLINYFYLVFSSDFKEIKKKEDFYKKTFELFNNKIIDIIRNLEGLPQSHSDHILPQKLNIETNNGKEKILIDFILKEENNNYKLKELRIKSFINRTLLKNSKNMEIKNNIHNKLDYEESNLNYYYKDYEIKHEYKKLLKEENLRRFYKKIGTLNLELLFNTKEWKTFENNFKNKIDKDIILNSFNKILDNCFKKQSKIIIDSNLEKKIDNKLNIVFEEEFEKLIKEDIELEKFYPLLTHSLITNYDNLSSKILKKHSIILKGNNIEIINDNNNNLNYQLEDFKEQLLKKLDNIDKEKFIVIHNNQQNLINFTCNITGNNIINKKIYNRLSKQFDWKGGFIFDILEYIYLNNYTLLVNKIPTFVIHNNKYKKYLNNIKKISNDLIKNSFNLKTNGNILILIKEDLNKYSYKRI